MDPARDIRTLTAGALAAFALCGSQPAEAQNGPQAMGASGASSELVFATASVPRAQSLDLNTRRDAALNVRTSERPTALDSWRGLARPDLSRDRRIYFPRHAESYLYFERDTDRSHGSRYEYFRRRY